MTIKGNLTDVRRKFEIILKFAVKLINLIFEYHTVIHKSQSFALLATSLRTHKI